MLGAWFMAMQVHLALEPLDQFPLTDFLFWFQVILLIGGVLWCLALMLTLSVGGWYAMTHPFSGNDRTIRRVAHVLFYLTFGLTEYLPPTSEESKLRGGVFMDQHEAERLARAIERTHVAWLQVDQIVFNETTNAYELKCSYRGPAGFLGTKAIWRTRWITTPREWIDLLTARRDTL